MSTYNIPVTRRRKALAAGLIVVNPILNGVEKVCDRTRYAYRNNLGWLTTEAQLDAFVKSTRWCPDCKASTTNHIGRDHSTPSCDVHFAGYRNILHSEWDRP